MSIVVLSADADFRALLVFLLRYHGMLVSVADADGVLPTEQRDERPTVFLVDLVNAGAGQQLLASATRLAAQVPLLVLCEPGTAAVRAQIELPGALAYLTVPVVPSDLVACVRRLSEQGAIQGYAAVATA